MKTLSKNTATRNFSILGRMKSLGYAFAGLRKFLYREHNARIHLVATMMVVSLSVLLEINRSEAISLAIVTGLVWMTEIINTAIEETMDHFHPELHFTVKYIKDLSAAAVLVASIVAIFTGGLIFIPKLKECLIN